MSTGSALGGAASGADESLQVLAGSWNEPGQVGAAMPAVDSEDEGPMLTAEEEMQYQRALWVNRLLQEQLAAQTEGLSIREIEEAQAQIQARMRDAQRVQAWSSGAGAASSRGQWTGLPGRSPPSRIAHSFLNRRRREDKIRQDNSALLRRLESVKSTFTPRIAASDLIQRISPRSRLVSGQRRDT